MTLVSQACSQTITMPSYHQQPPVAQNWDRWQQHQASPDYGVMNGIMSYDPRTVPSTAALQRPTMAPQYNLPTSYAESPVTPMSTSPYGSQSHFDYQSYTYQPTPTSSTNFTTQMPLRSAPRPIAPPTPPLDDERGMRLSDGRFISSARPSGRRTPRRSVSVVKSEASSEAKDIKTCPKYVKTDGSLQFESNKPIDKFLRVAKNVMESKPGASCASTPESIASPAAEEAPTGPKGSRKYACDICSAKFCQRAQLTTHKRAHTGEKPHKCTICDMRVSQPGNLKAHMRKHTGEKPYLCEWCGAVFASNGGRKVHIRNKHEHEPKKPCPMEGCKKEFSTIGNMKVHIDRFHIKELDSFMEMIAERERGNAGALPEKLQTLLDTLLRIYKNSNCGIKGRGAAPKDERDDKSQVSKRETDPQEMTPVSPMSTSTVQDYRQYYDQQHQQHYHGLPYPAQQPQQQPGYLQSPMQPQHSVYHGLPHAPQPYNMTWAPAPPQYH